MTSNIGNLHIVENHFSSRVWIQDHYLKIRLRLTRIHLQSFCFCTEICADNPDTFVKNKGYHFDEDAEMNLLGPKNGGESGRSFQARRHHCQRQCLFFSWAGLGQTSLAPSGPALPTRVLRQATVGGDCYLAAMDERGRERKRDGERKRELGRREGRSDDGGDRRRQRGKASPFIGDREWGIREKREGELEWLANAMSKSPVAGFLIFEFFSMREGDFPFYPSFFRGKPLYASI